MLLILTNSLDGTSDEIVRRVGSEQVFRFNVDLWKDYILTVNSNGFFISDPTGRTCRSEGIRAAYVRKPSFDDPLTIPEGGCEEAWLRTQIAYVVQELYNWCNSKGLVRLVEKGAQNRLGKFSQLWIAQKYFPVPRWRFQHNPEGVEVDFSPCIVKPLTADFIEEYQFLFTKRADPLELDPSYPWMIQKEVDASHDVTVVYVRGVSFAFRLDRATFEGVDWRKHINRQSLDWEAWGLSNEQEERIGRLDFLMSGDVLYFLEVNTNGQWAWLDEEGRCGVFDAVVSELTRDWSPQINPKWMIH
jgi:hypothetical protein